MRVLGRPAFSGRIGNPYNWLLNTNLEKLGVKVADYSKYKLLNKRWDILHFHWPENIMLTPLWRRAFFKVLNILIVLTFAKMTGTKIVWTVHNLKPHEEYHPRLSNYFMNYFAKQVDGFISLSATANELVMDRYPALRKVPSLLTPHGHYRDVYPNYVTKNEARKRLNIENPQAKVILFFGAIRSYKNIPLLIRTFRSMEERNTVLLIAGKIIHPKLEKEIIEIAAYDQERIRLHFKFIPEEDIQIYFNAADLVVLPYAVILNSGSALLALSYNVPVFAPSKGSFKDLQMLLGKEWVRTYSGELSSEELSFHLDYVSENMTSAYLPLEKIAWNEIALRTLKFYESLICK